MAIKIVKPGGYMTSEGEQDMNNANSIGPYNGTTWFNNEKNSYNIQDPIAYGQDYGTQYGQSLFGNQKDLTNQYSAALQERQNRLTKGISDSEAKNLTQQGSANLNQMRAYQARTGVRGGAAQAQQQLVQGQTSDRLTNANMLAKEKALDSYEKDVGKRIYGIQSQGMGQAGLEMQKYATDKGIALAAQPNPSYDKGFFDSVLCTHAFKQGDISKEVYLVDHFIGKSLPDDVVIGYHCWAVPLVKLMEKKPFVYKLIRPFIKRWAKQMAGEKNFIGSFLFCVGVPICHLIGKIISGVKEYEKLQVTRLS